MWFVEELTIGSQIKEADKGFVGHALRMNKLCNNMQHEKIMTCVSISLSLREYAVSDRDCIYPKTFDWYDNAVRCRDMHYLFCDAAVSHGESSKLTTPVMATSLLSVLTASTCSNLEGLSESNLTGPAVSMSGLSI